MRSATPKVLHKVGGLPVVGHVLRAVRAFGGEIAVVVGPDHAAVEEAVRAVAPEATIMRQYERRGTAHAVRMAEAAYSVAQGSVVVLYADTPLIRPETLAAIGARLAAGADIVVLGFRPGDPTGYGRLLMDGGRLTAIREHRDANEDERRIGLCNSGIMGFRAETLRGVIDRIGNANLKGEYYLTDAIELAVADGKRVEVIEVPADEVIGVDDRVKLAEAEAIYQARRRLEIMRGGATLRDPDSTFFSWDTQVGRDVTLHPHVVVGPGVAIAENVEIRAFCDLEEVTIGAGATIGPFARVRGGAEIGADVHLGNFVEIKKSRLGAGTKAGHLSYLGDAEIGAKTNIGAGTITCNYDGVNKDKTLVGDGVFIGTHSSLVAPVAIGDGAYIAAGSVITDDVPAGALALGRARQENKPGYAALLRDRALAKKARKGKA